MKIITIPLSIIFRFIVFIRNKFYDNGYLKQRQLDSIVISVGNLSAGGTGKTPFVELIAGYLLEKGKFVAIVLGGYKREHDDIKVIELGYDNSKHRLNTESVGDEAFLLLDNIDTKNGRGLIIVGDDKTKTAKFAFAKFKPDIIIIDDGFQHRRLNRDLDIVIMDGNEGKFLLPAGKLREPLKNKARADLVIINEKFDGMKILEKTGNSVSAVCCYEFDNFLNINKEPVNLEGIKAIAFCGIGDPESFNTLLGSKKINLLKFIEFSDHHNFTMDDINKIFAEFNRTGAEAIITTQKDFLRIKNFEVVLESVHENKYKQLLYSTPLYYTKIKTSFRKNGELLYSHLEKVAQLV